MHMNKKLLKQKGCTKANKTITPYSLFIQFSFVGTSEDIINGNLVKISQLDKYLGGDINVATLVVAVNTLRAVEYL